MEHIFQIKVNTINFANSQSINFDKLIQEYSVIIFPNLIHPKCYVTFIRGYITILKVYTT